MVTVPGVDDLEKQPLVPKQESTTQTTDKTSPPFSFCIIKGGRKPSLTWMTIELVIGGGLVFVFWLIYRELMVNECPNLICKMWVSHTVFATCTLACLFGVFYVDVENFSEKLKTKIILFSILPSLGELVTLICCTIIIYTSRSTCSVKNYPLDYIKYGSVVIWVLTVTKYFFECVCASNEDIKVENNVIIEPSLYPRCCSRSDSGSITT